MSAGSTYSDAEVKPGRDGVPRRHRGRVTRRHRHRVRRAPSTSPRRSGTESAPSTRRGGRSCWRCSTSHRRCTSRATSSCSSPTGPDRIDSRVARRRLVRRGGLLHERGRGAPSRAVRRLRGRRGAVRRSVRTDDVRRPSRADPPVALRSRTAVARLGRSARPQRGPGTRPRRSPPTHVVISANRRITRCRTGRSRSRS